MEKCVTHLIIGLGKGGAETMLCQVLKYRADPDLRYKVISLGASHYYEESIRALGIPVIELSIKKRPLTTLLKAFRAIKGSDTLCCWMYHANLIGYYLGRLAGVKHIVWGIHHSNLSKELNSKTTLWLNKWCAWISKKVDVVSYTGEIARSVHEAVGYSSDNGVVLSNGCNCDEYQPDSTAKESLCRELDISTECQLLLSVTKDLPIKDIPTFIRAFALLHNEQPDTVAVMCGSGVEAGNRQITDLCLTNGLTIGKDIFLLGMRHDVAHLLAGCDLYVLHSAGEAFPVTLVEAMSCGCLCVATDVGDVRRIMNDDLFICPPQEPQTLAEKAAVALHLSLERKETVRANNRSRVVNKYSIQNAVEAYEKLY